MTSLPFSVYTIKCPFDEKSIRVQLYQPVLSIGRICIHIELKIEIGGYHRGKLIYAGFQLKGYNRWKCNEFEGVYPILYVQSSDDSIKIYTLGGSWKIVCSTNKLFMECNYDISIKRLHNVLLYNLFWLSK